MELSVQDLVYISIHFGHFIYEEQGLSPGQRKRRLRGGLERASDIGREKHGNCRGSFVDR
jgi:hypothetical protein